MTQKNREHRIHYKLDQITPVNQYEMNTYNVPFAGNVSTCRETFVKGERVLEFNIVGDMTFEQFMAKPMFRDELVECLFSLSRQMVSLVQNGLNLNKMVLDLKYIYVRLSDLTVQTMYLPLEKEFTPQNVGDFIRSGLENITYAHTSAIECSNQILDYFDDHKDFDVFKFNNFIKEMRASSQLLIIQNKVTEEKKSEEARLLAELNQNGYEEEFATVVLTSGNEPLNGMNKEYLNHMTGTTFDGASPVNSYPAANCGFPILTRKNTGEQVYIDKQVFCIGKADQGVDYKITGNKSISRRHAYITCLNGTYYLRDNNSTNHIYLNGQQIYSNVEVAIPDNSIIRISNEEFIFNYR